MARIIDPNPPQNKNVFANTEDYRFYAGKYYCQNCGALVEMDASDILWMVDVTERYVNRDGKRQLWIQHNWNGGTGEGNNYGPGTPCCDSDAFFIEAKDD